MYLSNKKILLISPEPWSHIFVSKHHYAIHLSEENNDVFFLNPPGDRLKVTESSYPNLFLVDYKGFIKGLRFLPGIIQRYQIREIFKILEGLCKVEFDVIWSFDNSVFFDFDALPSRVYKISHIVDLNQNFQTRKAASTANICLCTTDHIMERLLRFNRNSFKVQHGFNSKSTSVKKIILPGSNNIKALYAGNLGMAYIDWCVIKDVVYQHNQIDFIFIGPNKETPCPLEAQSIAKKLTVEAANSYFVGRFDSKELLTMISAADVLMIVYQDEHHNDQANPHKMMEYLGSGRMIVATYTSEHESLAKDELILMSKSNFDYVGTFGIAVRNLAHWNCEPLVKRRKSFAEDNSYHNQIRRIDKLITA